MAKIESIRQHRHTISVTEDDETPVVVTLKRMTVDEWIQTETDLTDIRTTSVVDALKENVTKMVAAAKDGEESKAQGIASDTVRDGARAAINQIQALDKYTTERLVEHIVKVDGLEGVEAGGEVAALLEHRPIMLELWLSLTDASSLSETEKNV